MQKGLNENILAKLRIGSIQPFQVAEELKLSGMASFEIEKAKQEILKAYRKEHKCY